MSELVIANIPSPLVVGFIPVTVNWVDAFVIGFISLAKIFPETIPETVAIALSFWVIGNKVFVVTVTVIVAVEQSGGVPLSQPVTVKLTIPVNVPFGINEYPPIEFTVNVPVGFVIF